MTYQTTSPVRKSLVSALSREVGENYDSETGAQVIHTVLTSLVNTLNIEEQEIFPDASIIEDLGAESLDGLTLSFTIESGLGIRLRGYGNLLITEQNKPLAFVPQTVLGLASLAYNEKIRSYPTGNPKACRTTAGFL